MADLESSRIRLPPMKAIILDCIYDEDKELKSFLKHCVPTVLEELAINDQNSNDQGINMSYNRTNIELLLNYLCFISIKYYNTNMEKY